MQCGHVPDEAGDGDVDGASSSPSLPSLPLPITSPLPLPIVSPLDASPADTASYKRAHARTRIAPRGDGVMCTPLLDHQQRRHKAPASNRTHLVPSGSLVHTTTCDKWSCEECSCHKNYVNSLPTCTGTLPKATMVPQAYQLSTTQQHKHSNSKTEDIQTTVSLSVRITSYTSRVKSSWAIQL